MNIVKPRPKKTSELPRRVEKVKVDTLVPLDSLEDIGESMSPARFLLCFEF